MAASRVLLVVGAGTAGSLVLRNTKVSELLNDLSQVAFFFRPPLTFVAHLVSDRMSNSECLRWLCRDGWEWIRIFI